MTVTQVKLHPLDNAAWFSLAGPHAHFAEGTAKALRYPPDVSPFAAIPSGFDHQVWPAFEELAGPGQVLGFAGSPGLPDVLPPGWELVLRAETVQLVATEAFVTTADPEVVRLGLEDVDEMLELTARTRPGPFQPRTYQLGTYLGIRRDGELVAMAGERLRPPGWTEISAVCTAPAFRGQGLASRLVRALGHEIRDRGDTPLMHASTANSDAIRLYESLGFVVRRRLEFFALRTPERIAAE